MRWRSDDPGAPREATSPDDGPAASPPWADDTSPAGLARAARQRGDRFFQLQMVITSFVGATPTLGPEATDVLSAIEDEGWHLEHAGYVYVETGATSDPRLVLTGSQSRTSGYVQGVYLFRTTT